MLRRFALTCAALIATTVPAYAQAAVEYAMKSGNAIPAASRETLYIGACRVDSSLLSCADRMYTTPFRFGLIVVCILLFLAVTTRKRRAYR